MTYSQEFNSWFSPNGPEPAEPPGTSDEYNLNLRYQKTHDVDLRHVDGLNTNEKPVIGHKAPDTPKLELTSGRPAVITFLRHCGCPWAEKTYLNLRDIAKEHSEIDFVAVSHSDDASTHNWLQSLPQAGSGSSNLKVIVDDKLETYAAWGLGVSGWGHALSPFQLWNVIKIGREEGIWNRPTESGSRWQTSGSYAVDRQGIVRWGKEADRADDVPNFEDAVGAVLGEGKQEAKL